MSRLKGRTMSEPLAYRARHSAVYYTAPKSVDRRRLAAGLLVALLVAAAGSVAYVKVERSIEVIIYRLAGAIVAAIAVGVVAMSAVSYGRVRSPVLASAVGALIAIVALYVMWIVYVHDHINQRSTIITYGSLVGHPDLLVRLIRLLNYVGTWKLRSGNVMRGFPLTVIWAGEGTMVLLCGVLVPIKAVVSPEEIDCRECGAGCRLVRPILRFPMDVEQDLVGAVEGRQFSCISNLELPRTEDEPQLSLRLVTCPKCGETNVVTVNRVFFELAREGRKLVVKPVVDRLMISTVEAEELKGVLKAGDARREGQTSDERPVAEDSSQPDASDVQPSAGFTEEEHPNDG